jgi:hypothetical protein
LKKRIFWNFWNPSVWIGYFLFDLCGFGVFDDIYVGENVDKFIDIFIYIINDSEDKIDGDDNIDDYSDDGV